MEAVDAVITNLTSNDSKMHQPCGVENLDVRIDTSSGRKEDSEGSDSGDDKDSDDERRKKRRAQVCCACLPCVCTPTYV